MQLCWEQLNFNLKKELKQAHLFNLSLNKYISNFFKLSH